MLAIIGGTGLSELSGFELIQSKSLSTAYGDEPVELRLFSREGKQFVFLPRHGAGHQVPPHRINYRSNIAALSAYGVTEVVAVNAVGAMHKKLPPGSLAVPDQLIDYSHSREATFFDGRQAAVQHIDFTHPYTEALRQRIIAAALKVKADQQSQRGVLQGGSYACTQGPRLETAAEIRRLVSDGGDMVGMTGMPEAALAREMAIDYASLCLSVNWAAGLSEQPISLDEILKVVDSGMDLVTAVLAELVRSS